MSSQLPARTANPPQAYPRPAGLQLPSRSGFPHPLGQLVDLADLVVVLAGQILQLLLAGVFHACDRLVDAHVMVGDDRLPTLPVFMLEPDCLAPETFLQLSL